jgi:hypothetical protein
MIRITIHSSSRNKQLNPMTIWFILRADREFGEMAEWLKAHAWKVCIRL